VDKRPPTQHTRTQLFQWAAAFRDAIERADRSDLGITFQHFPRGSCGDAALLLGHFLKAHGSGETVYVSGERGEVGRDWTSHAWLRVDGFIVDVTADQFHDMDERVIVAITSPWHETFEVEDDHVGGLAVYDQVTQAKLAGIYAVIMKALDPVR
jgi:hypothetical protein